MALVALVDAVVDLADRVVAVLVDPVDAVVDLADRAEVEMTTRVTVSMRT